MVKTLLLVITATFIVSGCTSLDTDFQRAAAANIDGSYFPADIAISEIDGGWTHYSWKATTTDGKVYYCFADQDRANPKCKRKY